MARQSKALVATGWSAAEILLRQGVQFAIVIVLARLITPEEFGTIALLSLFIGLAGAFVESGMSAALIQRQDVTREDEFTVFWFNLGAAILVAFLLFLLAPAFAALYKQPILVPLTWILAVNIIVTALGTIHRTLLMKQLDFKPMMLVSVGATLTSGIVAIVLASKGYGVWALAMQALVAGVTGTGLLWLVSSWRPAPVFSISSVRKLFSFGGYILASSLLDIAYTRLYTLLIGKFYGIRELGFYARAETTAALPTSLLTSIIARVAFPAFSQVAKDVQRLRRHMRVSLQATMLLNAPAMLGLAAVAEPFIVTVFGDNWRPSAPILQVLCLAGLLMPLHVLNLQALMALGHSNLFFRLEVIKKTLGLGILAVSSLYGPIGMAWGLVGAGILSFFINAHYSGKFLDYGALRQLRDVAPVSGVSVLMAAGVALLHSILQDWPVAAQLGFEILAGLLLLGALILVLRLSAYKAVFALLRQGRT